ncbi:probable disease resistance protein At5g63020 [Prunus avium]|uniref:Probable disease resistance protein At5g63020 n=1 Tax=Prunus avium TaxID=42229 RepID=A0A6P5TRQ4_PRUAV|nr:probable disease resistance protein At5g63020 [Prunus avium]
MVDEDGQGRKRKRSAEESVTSVDESLRVLHEHEDQKRIVRFTLLAGKLHKKKQISDIDRWIKLVIRHYVEVLELMFKCSNKLIPRYSFPPASSDLGSLVVLRLHYCDISKEALKQEGMRFSCLKELSLLESDLHGLTNELLSRCPSIETLKFNFCKNLKDLQLCGFSKLKTVELLFTRVYRYKIEASSLQTLRYSYLNDPLDLEAINCINLKELIMQTPLLAITTQYIATLLLKFPFLEKLNLEGSFTRYARVELREETIRPVSKIQYLEVVATRTSIDRASFLLKKSWDKGNNLLIINWDLHIKDHLRKAEDIFRVLKSKKFALLLDDIWERVDLAKIGVPIPDRQNTSKLVFKTRSEEVCSRMGAHKKIKVECLAWDRAWTLFQEKVGEETLYIHPDIPKLAEIVAKECDGLPLALITIGRAMACKKTPQEWNHAIQVLKRSASEFSEDFLIHKRRLIYCWVGEEILDEYDDITGAQNQGYDIIGTLVNACLLEGREDYVRMHDVIRDMAMWLACECGKAKENFLVHTGAHLIEAPDFEKWKGAKRMSLMANQIENLVEGSICPSLSTLFLTNNRLKMISEGFFQHMPSLRVLDLSENKGITHLPMGISKLKSPQYLNLSQTGIRDLPIELKALDKLKYLNLEFTSKLNMVPRNVISSFLMLRVLRMYDCGSSDDVLFGGEEALVEELVCLKHLDVLTITIRCVSAFKRFFTSLNLLTCTQVLCLESFTCVSSLDKHEMSGYP